jgi:hypothetical protein
LSVGLWHSVCGALERPRSIVNRKIAAVDRGAEIVTVSLAPLPSVGRLSADASDALLVARRYVFV